MIPVIANKITAFVLVFILFAHNITTLTIIGDFIMNQDFIAKTLCVQKDNQQGCNGKCHLMKELKDTEPDSKTTIPVKETKRFSLDAFCFYNIKTSENNNFIYQETCINLDTSSKKLISTYLDIDTPPPISC